MAGGEKEEEKRGEEEEEEKRGEEEEGEHNSLKRRICHLKHIIKKSKFFFPGSKGGSVWYP